MSQLFLLDPRDAGGLALTTPQVGFIYNTVGLVTFIFGALLGGFAVARRGLKFWLWPMLLAIHLPDAVFIWLAYAQPQNLFVDRRGRRGRAVRLRLRFHGDSALPDLHRARRTSDGALRDLHRFHGAGHDAAGNVERLVAGMPWLSAFFCLGHSCDDSELPCRPKIPLDAEFGKRNRAN